MGRAWMPPTWALPETQPHAAHLGLHGAQLGVSHRAVLVDFPLCVSLRLFHLELPLLARLIHDELSLCLRLFKGRDFRGAALPRHDVWGERKLSFLADEDSRREPDMQNVRGWEGRHSHTLP